MRPELIDAKLAGREAGRLDLAKDLNPYEDGTLEALAWETERLTTIARRWIRARRGALCRLVPALRLARLADASPRRRDLPGLQAGPAMIEILLEVLNDYGLVAAAIVAGVGVLFVIYSLAVCWWLTRDPDA